MSNYVNLGFEIISHGNNTVENNLIETFKNILKPPPSFLTCKFFFVLFCFVFLKDTKKVPPTLNT